MEYIFKNFEKHPEKNKALSLEDMIKFVGKTSFSDVLIKESNFTNFDKDVIKTIYNTKECPFGIVDDERLYIHPDYYLNHTLEVDHLLEEIFKLNHTNVFSIYNSELMKPNLIKALSENKELEVIYFAFDYILTLEDYKILKNSSIKSVRTKGVCKELKDNFDSLIFYNCNQILIKPYYTYNDLATFEKGVWRSFDFLEKITSEELVNLKYIQSDLVQITIHQDNMEDALLLTNRFNELGKTYKIRILINDRQAILEKILEDQRYLNANIILNYQDEDIDIQKFIASEKKLYQLMESSKELSPFEKFIVAYDTTKKYKKYKENFGNAMSSRNLFAILDGEYIVCTGFINLLNDLLSKGNIPFIKHSLMVDTSYDEKDENEIAVATKVGHARGYVYIKDPKYNIDGFYVTDPTWDNIMNKDMYNHLVLTNKEENMTRRYNFVAYDTYSFNENNFFELYNIDSIEEFYEKINFILEHHPTKTLFDIIEILLSQIGELSPCDGQMLLEKYISI